MTAIDDLNKGWTIKRFEELFAEPQRNGIYKTKEFHGRGQKIINMGELFGYDFISDQEMKRVELTPKELEKFLVKDGDLLFARRSLVLEGSGKCSLVVRPSEDTTFESSIIRTRLNKNEAEPKFYYYLFRSPLGRALMSSIATQTAVSGITGSNLVQLRVPHPPLPIQRKIAGILSAYDDLIENNTRRIEILEEMARSIYREWFVQFRFPGHEQVQMVDSELGLIPEGWEVGKLGDVSCVIPGYAFKSKDWQKTGIPVIKIKNINADNTVDIQQTDFVCQSILTPKIKKYLLKGGEFLIAMTGATAGKVGKLRTKEPMLLNQRVAKIEPLHNYRSYIWQIISSEEGQNRFFKLADGAAQPNMSGLQIEEVRIILPSLSLCTDFDSIVNDIYRQIDNFIFRNQNLHQTRDLLLPRLISGEIDVENLDINTGEIAA